MGSPMNEQALLHILRDVAESLQWLLQEAVNREKHSPLPGSPERILSVKTAAGQLQTIRGTLERVDAMLREERP